MDKKTKAQVRIFGSKYTLVGTESEEYIQSIAAQVDKKMQEISKNPNLRPMRISVLTSINFCDEYQKAKEELSLCRQELEKCRGEIKVLEEERRFLKDEIKTIRGNRNNE